MGSLPGMPPAASPAFGPPGSGRSADLSVDYPAHDFVAHAPGAPQAPVLVHALPDPVTFRVALGALPPGLRLAPDTGVIAGTPTAPGTFLFAIAATAGPRTAVSRHVIYTVTAPDPLTLTYPPAPAAGFPVRTALPPQTPVLANGTPGQTPTFALAGGDWPKGLHLNPTDGTVSGTPREAGSHTFTLRAQSWHRVAEATLTYVIAPGPAPRLAYDDLVADTRELVHTAPLLEHFPAPGPGLPPQTYTVASGALPPGLTLLPGLGQIMGRCTTPGTYTFTVELRDAFDTVVSPPVTCRVVPYTPLNLTFQATPAVLDPGDRAELSWVIAGRPASLSLTRNLLTRPDPAAAPDPDLDPALPVPAGGALQVPVTRRQTFTLAAKPRPGDKPVQRTATVAVRGVEAVAGLATYAHPPQAYASGPADRAHWRHLRGGAWHGGRLFLAEGPDQTIRALTLADGSLAPFLGVPGGPARGPLLHSPRLNQPGPMAVLGDTLYFADVANHTLRHCPVDDPSALAVLAGEPGQPGAADGIGAAARFGTLKELAALPGSGLLLAADLEHGLRLIRPATGEVKTLACAPALVHGHPWHALDRPVALAVAPERRPDGSFDGRVFLTTETRPGGPARDPNPLIQVLQPADPDLWHTTWVLRPFAGSVPGYQDGSADTARFKQPTGMAVVGQRLLVADRGNHALRSVALDTGRVTTLAGRWNAKGHTIDRGFFDDADALKAAFKSPSRIIPGPDPGTCFVLDQEETALRLITGVDTASPQVATPGGIQAKDLPDVARDDLDPADPEARLKKARLKQPASVAVERRTGVAYLAEPATHAIRAVNLPGTERIPAGHVTTLAGKLNARGPALPGPTPFGAARFDEPADLGLDGQARLFVLEPKAGRVRMLDQGEVTTRLDGLTAGPGGRIHMAVRPGGAGLALALSTFSAAGPDPGWRVLLHHQDDPASPLTASLVVRTGPVPPKALAVDLQNRVYVLTEDADAQECVLTVYGTAASAPGAWVGLRRTPFGPGAAVGAAYGFPDIQAMAADTKGNLYLADLGNALVWRFSEDDGSLAPVAGTPMVHELTGEGTRPLDAPLYRPMGLAVTGDDDLLVTCGDALVQITAPGLPGQPWTPAKPVAWTSQRASRSAAVLPVPAPGAGRKAGSDMVKELEAKQKRTLALKAAADGRILEAAQAYLDYLALLPAGKFAPEAAAFLRTQAGAALAKARAAAAGGAMAEAGAAYQAFLRLLPLGGTPADLPDLDEATAFLAAHP